jgi:aminoglycoside phosphotransferase (APT) family kinase protein
MDPMTAGLERFLSNEVEDAVTVVDLLPLSSVGNAREPWSFSARWGGGEIRCVMLIKADGGPLKTELRPEFRTLVALAGSSVPAPRALWMDETGSWLGRPFFVTERVPGSADTRLLRRAEDADTVRAVARDLATAAARLHALDVAPFEGHLAPADVGTTAATQLASWQNLFLQERLEPHPALVYGFAWLGRHLPVATRVSVVHGDLRFGNLLHDDGRLTALLDWEMVHLGDPVEDLGWVYRALWSPAGALAFGEFLAAYAAADGVAFAPEHLRWYEIFSEVKHSVISLTATRSFVDGATTNLRHADRSATVPSFAQRMLELVAMSC